jgi:hypothetical protein
MQQHRKQVVPRWAAITAAVVGIAGGSYGIASAASGTTAGTTTQTTTTAAAQPAAALSQSQAQSQAQSQPWGGQRSDETPLTGDALAKVTAAAQAKVSGGTIIRVETDADGNAAYEAHMTDSSGAPVTVYVDKSYNVVSVETR